MDMSRKMVGGCLSVDAMSQGSSRQFHPCKCVNRNDYHAKVVSIREFPSTWLAIMLPMTYSIHMLFDIHFIPEFSSTNLAFVLRCPMANRIHMLLT